MFVDIMYALTGYKPVLKAKNHCVAIPPSSVPLRDSSR